MRHAERMTTVSAPAQAVPTWTVGDRLRKAREITGLDRQAWAHELGIARNSVAKYEASDEVPRQVVLLAWAMRSGVPVEWLASGETAPTPPTSDAPSEINTDYSQIREILHCVAA